MFGRKRGSDQFDDTQLHDHSLESDYTRPRSKRSRTSSQIEPQSAKLIEQRKIFLEQLKDHFPFCVQYRDQAPSSIRKSVSTPHSINQPSEHGIRVWITGLNVDNEVFTLRKSTGLIVLIEYRPPNSSSSSPSCYYQTDALSSSALCTFLSHVHSGEITQSQLLNFFRSSNSSRTLLSITARFPMINGFTRMIYVNTYNQLALLADLFTRGVRVRNNDDIPKLTKMLKPKKDTNFPSHVALSSSNRIVASPYASRQNVASIKGSASSAALNGRKFEEPAAELDSLSDDDGSISDSSSPQSLHNNSASQSSSSRVPFDEYEYVLTWWCPSSPSYARVSSLFNSLSSAYPEVGVCELTCEDVDVELVLTRMGIRILSALSAPTIRASSQLERQRELMEHLHSKLQSDGNKLPAPLPLRLEDACLVISDRQFFVRTVFPFIVRPSTMYELTPSSPALEFGPVIGTAVKQEDNTNSSLEAMDNHAAPDNKARSTSIELVSSHIRRTCAPSSFLLYSLQTNTPSLFFSPVLCKSIYSMSVGHLIERPCVIEWPSHMPFNTSVLTQWCQFHVRFGSVSHVMVVIPCRCWQLSTVTEMHSCTARDSLIGQQQQRCRASNVSSVVPQVVLKNVFSTARPALLVAARQNKLQISDDSHFFVAHFDVLNNNQQKSAPASRSTISLRSTSSAPPPDSPPHLSPATPVARSNVARSSAARSSSQQSSAQRLFSNSGNNLSVRYSDQAPASVLAASSQRSPRSRNEPRSDSRVDPRSVRRHSQDSR